MNRFVEVSYFELDSYSISRVGKVLYDAYFLLRTSFQRKSPDNLILLWESDFYEMKANADEYKRIVRESEQKGFVEIPPNNTSRSTG